jgi:hypothetical protein
MSSAAGHETSGAVRENTSIPAGSPTTQARHGCGPRSPGTDRNGIGAVVIFGVPYSWTPRMPTTMPLISEIRPRHHTPALLGTGVPFVL